MTQQFDYRAAALILAILMPLLLWMLKVVWDTNISKEMRNALKDWMEIKKQVGSVFENRNHAKHKPIYDALQYYFIGSSIANIAKIGVFIGSGILLLLVGINIYFISFWQTGTLKFEEFRTLFSLIVLWGIMLFVFMIVVHIGINIGNKIRRTEYARPEE